MLVANEDGVVRQIEERGLLAERFFGSCARGDLRVKLRVAAREVRRSRLDPDLQLIARQPERILHAAAPDAQPADEQGRQREDGDAQDEVEVQRDRIQRRRDEVVHDERGEEGGEQSGRPSSEPGR